MKEFSMFAQTTFQEEKIPVIMIHQEKETSVSWRVFTHLT